MAGIRRKLVAVGDAGCGKTSLLLAFSQGALPKVAVPPLLDPQLVNAPLSGGQIQLFLWDTSDREEFRSLRSAFYFDCDVVLVCFSIDSPESLDNVVKKWAPEVRNSFGDGPTILVGCKKDLRCDAKTKAVDGPRTLQKRVDSKQARKVGRKIGAKKYIECSAVTHEGVQEIFEKATQAVSYTRSSHDHRGGKCSIL
jgi:small GTP-binding protein